MKKICSWLVMCIITLVCAVAVVSVIIDDDPWLRERAGSMVQELLQNILHTPIAMQKNTVRLIRGNIMIYHVAAAAPDKQWMWHIGAMELRISWRRLFTQRKLFISCVLHDLICSSDADDTHIPLIPHIQQLFNVMPDEGMIVIESVAIASGTCTIRHPQGLLKTDFYADGILGVIPQPPHGTMSFHWKQGEIHYQGDTIVSDVAGSYRYDYAHKTATYDTNLQWFCQSVSEKAWFLRGSCHSDGGEVRGGTLSGSSSIEGRWNTKDDIYTIKARVPVNSFMAAVPFLTYIAVKDGVIEGVCSGKVSAPCTTYAAVATVRNLSWRDRVIPRIVIAGGNNNEHFHGSLELFDNDDAHAALIFSGALIDNHINIHGTNEKAINISGYVAIPPHGVESTCSIDLAKKHIHGAYAAKARLPGLINILFNLQSEEFSSIKGSFSCIGDQVITKGNMGKYSYEIGASCAQRSITHGIISRHNDTRSFTDEPMLTLRQGEESDMMGSLSYQFLLPLAQYYGIHLPGNGSIMLKLATKDNRINAHIALSDANIRIPYTYNVVKQVDAHFLYDHVSKKVEGSCAVALHKGSLDGAHITCCFDDHGAITFAHVPLIFKDYLISWEKDLFSLVSGALTIRYHAHEPLSFQGFVVCDRSHARDNIFSKEFQQHVVRMTTLPFSLPHTSAKSIASLSSTSTLPLAPSGGVTSIFSGAHFDISCMTRTPLRVQTSFLECSAHIDVHAQGTMMYPLIKGEMNIIQGSFLFPYKPLFIKRGVIYMTQQVDDPAVEIIAENSIKGYQIRLLVNGTLSEPNITFESTPTLSEEQIIGLLWGGSEDGSLYVAMSTMIMQSLERLIFGPASSTSLLQQKLKQLFRPLGNVRIVPGFTDQTARGGLRGSLAIEVNDRLRGIIKQNFDLPEDTMYEVEYDVSDEIRMRAFKDERSDLGAEIEGRWKF